MELQRESGTQVDETHQTGGTASLGDDARETLTMASLEKAKERNLEQHLRLRLPQTLVVLSASVDQYLRTTVDSSSMQPTSMDINAAVSTCACYYCDGQSRISQVLARWTFVLVDLLNIIVVISLSLSRFAWLALTTSHHFSVAS